MSDSMEDHILYLIVKHERVTRLVSQDDRCLITPKTARKGLQEILRATALPLSRIAKAHKDAKNISSIIDWLQSPDGAVV